MGEFLWWFHSAWSYIFQYFLSIGILLGVVGFEAPSGSVLLVICRLLNVSLVKNTDLGGHNAGFLCKFICWNRGRPHTCCPVFLWICMVNVVRLQVLNDYSMKCPIGHGHLEFINVWLFACGSSRNCNRIVFGDGQICQSESLDGQPEGNNNEIVKMFYWPKMSW